MDLSVHEGIWGVSKIYVWKSGKASVWSWEDLSVPKGTKKLSQSPCVDLSGPWWNWALIKRLSMDLSDFSVHEGTLGVSIGLFVNFGALQSCNNWARLFKLMSKLAVLTGYGWRTIQHQIIYLGLFNLDYSTLIIPFGLFNPDYSTWIIQLHSKNSTPLHSSILWVD